MSKDLFSRIETHERFTASETKLIRYFQENDKYLALKTIYDISKGAAVSTATVTRFLTRLGYADFADFKTRINQELMGSLDSSFERYKLSKQQLLDDAKSTWSQFCKLAISDIEAAHSGICEKTLKQAATLIAKAKGTVYLIGQFNSYIIAHLLYQQLTLLRPRVVFLNNQAGNMAYQMIDVDADDLLFAVTYQRYAHQTTLTVKEFAKKKAKIIVLNDSVSSPVSGYADIEITLPIAWPAVFGSRCSGLVVVEGLTVLLAQMLEDSFADRITDAMILAGRFHSFSHKIQQNRLFQKGLELNEDNN